MIKQFRFEDIHGNIRFVNACTMKEAIEKYTNLKENGAKNYRNQSECG